MPRAAAPPAPRPNRPPLPSTPAPHSATPAPPTVIPAPPPSFLRRQEPAPAGTHHHHPTSPIPNSSLPPSRGEVRWGVECCEPPPRPYTPRSPTRAPLRHSCAPTVIPAQAGNPRPSRHSRAHHRHSCAGRNLCRQEPTTTIQLPPSPIHPSPLPEGRLGGGWNAASRRTTRTAPQSPTPSITTRAPLRHPHAPPVIPTPLPSFLRSSPAIPAPAPVIPAQAGTTPHPHFPQILLYSHQNRSAKPCPSPRKAAPADPTPPPSTTHSPSLTKP